jgi:hypothetical protein
MRGESLLEWQTLMRSWKILPLVLLALFQSSGCGFVRGFLGWFHPPISDVTIYYLPLEGDVAAPVTADGIEIAPGICRVVISGRIGQATTLRQILRRTVPGDFRKDSVRVKIIGLLDEEVFIDSGGGVLFGRTRKEAQLRFNDLNSFKRQIATQTKRRACREAQGAPGSQS